MNNKKMILVGLIAVFSISTAVASFQEFKPDYWPTDGWRSKLPSAAGFNADKFDEVSDYVFKSEDGHVSNSLVIIKDGYVVHEEYANGFGRDSKHLLWSVSKSISNLVFAAARKERYISENDLLKKYYPDLPKDKESMTLKNILQMSSSIDFRETYESDPTNSDVVNILYLKGRNDIVNYVMNRPLKGEPGSIYYYSSGDTTLFLGALRKAFGGDDEEFWNYPTTAIFGPLGITNFTLEKDRDGNFYGASSFYLTAQDLGKIGLLVMSKGQWGQDRLFESEWIDFITTPAPQWIKQNPEPGKVTHSAQWWLNQAYPEYDYAKPLPDAPDNTILALGHFGQKIIILPTQRIVIVRTGKDKKVSIDQNKMIKLVMEALK